MITRSYHFIYGIVFSVIISQDSFAYKDSAHFCCCSLFNIVSCQSGLPFHRTKRYKMAHKIKSPKTALDRMQEEDKRLAKLDKAKTGKKRDTTTAENGEGHSNADNVSDEGGISSITNN